MVGCDFFGLVFGGVVFGDFVVVCGMDEVVDD